MEERTQKLIIDSSTVNDFSEEKPKFEQDLFKAKKYAMIAILIMSLTNLEIKFMTNIYPTSAKNCFSSIRNMGISLSAYIYMKYSGLNPAYLFYMGKERNWMIFRIIMLSCSNAILMLSLYHIKMTIVTVASMTAPIISSVIATICLGEKLIKEYMYSCVISLLGVLIMLFDKLVLGSNSDEEEDPNKIYLLGLLFTVMYVVFGSFLNVSLKVIGKEFDNFNINYISAFWASAITFTYCLLFEEWNKSFVYTFDIGFFLMSFTNGFATFIFYYFLYIAVMSADFNKINYVHYLILPMQAFYGIVIFSESFTFLEFVGSLLIVCTVIYSTLYLK